MAKLTAEKIEAIREAYKTIGTYSGVAKAMGCSAATVKKYVDCAAPVTKTINANIRKFDKEIIPVEMIDFTFERREWTALSPEEVEGVNKLHEEM